MNAAPPFSRADFEQLLADHGRLVEAMNDLEYQLYRLGGLPADGSVADCQQAGGALIRLLRDALFRQDQLVLPLLEARLTLSPPVHRSPAHERIEGLAE